MLCRQRTWISLIMNRAEIIRDNFFNTRLFNSDAATLRNHIVIIIIMTIIHHLAKLVEPY